MDVEEGLDERGEEGRPVSILQEEMRAKTKELPDRLNDLPDLLSYL